MRYLVYYVENSSPKIKTFFYKYTMLKFINTFNNKYPQPSSLHDGYWVEFTVEDIKGKITKYV